MEFILFVILALSTLFVLVISIQREFKFFNKYKWVYVNKKSNKFPELFVVFHDEVEQRESKEVYIIYINKFSGKEMMDKAILRSNTFITSNGFYINKKDIIKWSYVY